MKIFLYPPNISSVSVPPIQFNLDSVATTVSKDTVTPANSKPLPVEVLNSSTLPISGSVSVSNFPATQPVSGSVSVSNFPATQPVSGTVTANLGTIAGVATESTLSGLNTKVVTTANGIKVDGSAVTQPVSGSVSVSNFPATQPVSGSVSISNFPAVQPISATALPLPSGASTLAEQQSQTTAIGSLTETAPATDTASSGLNGRLQRIAQRLTSLIALLPASIGTKASNASLSVVLASDQATVPTQPQTSSGTITQVQKAVGLTAVRATVSGSAPAATRKRLIIKPSKNNTGSIYFGSSSVTISNGLEIIGPDTREFLLDSSDYYLISDTAAQVVEIIEVV